MSDYQKLAESLKYRVPIILGYLFVGIISLVALMFMLFAFYLAYLYGLYETRWTVVEFASYSLAFGVGGWWFYRGLRASTRSAPKTR